jgi:hypothetical protein
MRKLRNMSPEQKAVIQTASVSRMFAQEDADRMLQYMALADRKRRFGLRHGLARRGFKLAEDEYKFRKDQRDIATGIAGAGVLGAGAMGWMDILESRKQAKRYDLMTKRLGMGVG